MSQDLVLSEKLSDVTLKVRHGGYSWRFPAHSLMLNAVSPLFRELLEDRINEDRIDDSPLTIIGLTPETVLAIINYIYLGTIPTNITANLLVAAEKYGLKSLRDQLEEKLLPNITVTQACELLDSLENEQPHKDKCAVKLHCLNILKKHAYRVFASDLVLSLSRKLIQELIKSDELNVPDESVVFWGIWRWGLYHSSRNGRTLDEGHVSCYVEDLLKFLRKCSLRNKEKIPTVASQKFSCRSDRRSVFCPPDDSLEQSSNLRTCGTWEDIVDVNTDTGQLCLQISFDKDVMLLGFTLEACCTEKTNGIFVRIFQELSGKELSRQEINCGRVSSRKLSRTGDPESWIESDIILLKPLILNRSQIYSIYLELRGTPWGLPRYQLQSQKDKIKKTDSTFSTFHGQYVTAIRELYLVPDMTVSWRSGR